jgi:hypothetical protein
MLDTKHYTELTNLIDKFNKERNNLTITELQTLREDMALTFFYLADFSSRCIANYDSKSYFRKSLQSEKEEYYRNQIDERTGKNYNVADSERLARITLKDAEKEEVEALRQKEKVKIVTIATQQILNSISSRMNQLNK